MASVIYNSFKKKIQDGSIDLDSDNIYLALVDSNYTPDQDSHTFFSSITGELSGTGYTAGGTILANKSVVQDNTNNLAYFTSDNVVFSAINAGTIAGLVLYKSTGSAATSPLLCYIDISDTATNGGNVTVVVNSGGWLKLT